MRMARANSSKTQFLKFLLQSPTSRNRTGSAKVRIFQPHPKEFAGTRVKVISKICLKTYKMNEPNVISDIHFKPYLRIYKRRSIYQIHCPSANGKIGIMYYLQFDFNSIRFYILCNKRLSMKM